MSLRPFDDPGIANQNAAPEALPLRSHLRLEDVLRLLLISALVLVGGFAIGNFTFSEIQGRGTPYFIVVACLVVVATTLAYYKFEFCLLLYLATAWMTLAGTPGLATGGSGTGKGLYPVELGMVFLLFMWLVRALSQRRLNFVRTPMNVPLAVWLAFCIWTAINGRLFWDPAVARFYGEALDGGRTAPLAVIMDIILRVLSLGAFWLVASNLTDPIWLRRACIVLLLPGLATFLAYLHVVPAINNGWFVLFEIVLAATLWAWLLEQPGMPAAGPELSRRKLLWALGWGFLGAIIVQAFYFNIRWISGWAGILVALLFVAWLKSKKLFAGLVCLIIVFILAFQPFLHQHVVHKVQTSGDTDRLLLARAAVQYALHFPFGIGVGNFRAYNAFYGSHAQWDTTTYTSAHNFYAQTLSETGFIGLILTLIWVVFSIRMLIGFYRRMPPGFSRTMTLGIAGMWVGVCVATYFGDYLIPVYHNGGIGTLSTTIYAWLGLGIAVALARQNHVLEEASEAAPSHAAIGPARISPADYYPRRMSR